MVISGGSQNIALEFTAYFCRRLTAICELQFQNTTLNRDLTFLYWLPDA